MKGLKFKMCDCWYIKRGLVWDILLDTLEMLDIIHAKQRNKSNYMTKRDSSKACKPIFSPFSICAAQFNGHENLSLKNLRKRTI